MIDSNSVLFHFILPSLFAAIFSAILQGVGQSSASATLTAVSAAGATSPNTLNYSPLIGSGRDATVQGGFQMAGWGISIGCGAVAGLIIGLLYRLLNDNFNQPVNFFNDATLF